jgi:hypothetical protein
VLPTQETTDHLAGRIERAFYLQCSKLRRSNWYRGCPTPRVWHTAATVLWQVHAENPEIPLDPELYVASQVFTPPFVDPWSTLAQAGAGQRYLQVVRRIVHGLRKQLGREVRRAENLLREGRSLAFVLRLRDPSLSALGLYITAQRAGRPDLADRLRFGAIEQHRGCPLYRLATRKLLAVGQYPVEDLAENTTKAKALPVPPRKIASLN